MVERARVAVRRAENRFASSMLAASGSGLQKERKRGRESFVDSTGRVGIDAMGNATASSFSNRWIWQHVSKRKRGLASFRTFTKDSFTEED
jgi:hypothetical protein